MSYMNTGALERHTISPHTGSAVEKFPERRRPLRTRLSTLELQRLVAAMVD
jgi:hypothetical protein